VVAELLKQIVTFGAAGRVEDAVGRYEEVLARASELEARIRGRQVEAKLALESLVALKRDCVPDLALVRSISKHLKAKERTFTAEVVAEDPPSVCVAQIESVLGPAELALGTARGLAAGASTAMGAWALAGSVGAASTGTALAGLSGAAAQSATLAWFGGGSLAAGGLGVAGGAAVLTSIAAVPALAVMATLAHLKANDAIARYAEETTKALLAIDTMEKQIVALDIADQRARELTEVLAKTREAYRQQYRVTLKRVYRFGWLSRALRWLRKLFGKDYFSEPEVAHIQGFLKCAVAFSKVLDQRVFELQGSAQEQQT